MSTTSNTFCNICGSFEHVYKCPYEKPKQVRKAESKSCPHGISIANKCGTRHNSMPEMLISQIKAKSSAERKAEPIFSGVLQYFPDAIAAVSRVSKKGNDKHNPGQPLHWSRDKSSDHLDCLVRHVMTSGEKDEDTGELHLAHAAWRVLAALQLELEKQNGPK